MDRSLIERISFQGDDSPLMVANSGAEIVSSNYWGSEFEKAGLVLYSPNAGCIRILLPSNKLSHVKDMLAAEYAILSIGSWQGQELAVELLFEDFSSSPFCMHAFKEAFVFLPSQPKDNQEWRVSAWCGKENEQPIKLMEKVCYWRQVKNLPYLKPLGE